MDPQTRCQQRADAEANIRKCLGKRDKVISDWRLFGGNARIQRKVKLVVIKLKILPCDTILDTDLAYLHTEQKSHTRTQSISMSLSGCYTNAICRDTIERPLLLLSQKKPEA